MVKVVLDASVLLAVIYGEPGATVAIPALRDGLISAVNLAEVCTKLAFDGLPQEEIEQAVEMGFLVVNHDRDQAIRTGVLRATTARYGLSLGDRACLALALSRGLPVLTADRTWAQLALGVDVRLIR